MRYDRRAFFAAVGAAALTPPLAFQAGRAPATPQFPALSQRIAGHPLAYLDNAATTLRPREVIDAMVRFYQTDNANPSGTLHALARRSAALLVGARETVARFVNASGSDEIVFTRGTTEGINLVAATWGVARVRGGDQIVVTLAEHASNLFPWQRLAAAAGARVTAVHVAADGELRLDDMAAAMTPQTRLVAVTHVSNVLGTVYPVAGICALARKAGAAVLIDAAQSAPHIKLDVQALGCDFLAFSSHKMLGPMGVGVLWVRRDRFAEMPAYHVGSNMAHGGDIETATAEGGALRFQAGTPDVSGPVGLAAAIGVLDRVGFQAMADRDRALSAHGLSRLREVPGLRLFGTFEPANRVPVFSFTLEGVAVPAIVAAADAAGVAIRGGDLAALPLLQRFGVSTAARASAYLYNTTAEIDRLVDVLTKLARK